MGGEIYLDDHYFSGIEGHPGTRFVVDMQASSVEPPSAPNLFADSKSNGARSTKALAQDDTELPLELPVSLKILFTDDDGVLRKLFKRSIKRVAPEWTVREASNGETALALTDKEEFDIIFVDMYMASVEKQLLGTETVAALRNKGVTSRLCGLSANDKEDEYYQAGADAFMFKPFPCETYELTQALCKILYQNEKGAEQEDGKVSFVKI